MKSVSFSPPAPVPVSDNVFRICLKRSSCYLLRTGEDFLLVDTGYPNDHERFLQALSQLCISPDRIKYLFLTHHHNDHAGFATLLQKESGCRFVFHERGLPFLKTGTMDQNMTPRTLAVRASLSLLRSLGTDYLPLSLFKDEIVLSGDDDVFLPSIGIQGRILATPGHTADSLSILLDDGTAIVGDAFMNLPLLCGRHREPIVAADFREASESRKKLWDMGAKVILPSHGKPFRFSCNLLE